jgi:hypothetical protein
VIANDLTRQPHANSSLRQEHLSFRDGHARWFAFDEFDPAGRASRVTAAGMQLVDVRVLLERQHETLTIFDIKRSESFNGQLGHV